MGKISGPKCASRILLKCLAISQKSSKTIITREQSHKGPNPLVVLDTPSSSTYGRKMSFKLVNHFGRFPLASFHSIGNLPEVLPNVSYVIKHDLELIKLPISTVLHKALQLPSSGFPNQTSVMNIYAARNYWLSNLDGAEQYVEWGYENLLNFELVFQQTILQLAIGYEITWKDLFELLRYYGDVITNDYSYHPAVDGIKKRSCHPQDWFVVNQQPTILKSRNTTFGGSKQDLSRVSFTKALDIISRQIQFLNLLMWMDITVHLFQVYFIEMD
ncbi:unnamed protein product [Adineta ricciae]|uniref:Uncharacterized protein n=1 Tax=Adineta ricciae TaxID=249248 RepID=A0A815FBV2_ADIRI|nr:unnamed protein product [Adineta ricciae]